MIFLILIEFIRRYLKMMHKPTLKKEPKRANSSMAIQRPKENTEKVNFIHKNKNVNGNSTKKISQKRQQNILLAPGNTANKTNIYQQNNNSKPPLFPNTKPSHHENPHKLPIIRTIPQKVEHLQKMMGRISGGNPQMQDLLLQEIKGIKNQLKEIKEQMGLGNSHHRQKDQELENQHFYLENDGNQNIFNMVPREQPQKIKQYQPEPQRIKQYNNQSNQQVRYEQQNYPIKNSSRMNEEVSSFQMKNNSRMQAKEEKGQNFSNVYEANANKDLLQIGKIQPYMKEFKLDGVKGLQPFYRGYHKKSSKPIVIKYCKEGKTMDAMVNLYEKLWKNIVKAKKICLNKIYDLNEPLACNILALEMNRYSLQEALLNNIISKEDLLKDIFRGIQFFHQCGFLYRNVHPNHVMINFQNQVVLLDLKRIKKYIDFKGKLVEVKASNVAQSDDNSMDEFISNARLRCIGEGRKDDFQSFGYLALYVLEGHLPWNMQNIMKQRSKMTLQQLYGKYPGLMQFMIKIHHMKCEDTPEYEDLFKMIVL